MTINSTYNNEDFLQLSSFVIELEKLQETVLMATVGMSLTAMLTLLIPIIIAPGLEGNTSAQTFMWVQALCEIIRRGVLVSRGVCVTFGQSKLVKSLVERHRKILKTLKDYLRITWNCETF